MIRSTGTLALTAAVATCATLWIHDAAAQSTAQPGAPWSDTWRFGASLYIYGPSIDADFSLPRRSGSGNVIVKTDDFFDSINGAFMGAFEANNGRWGVFTDYLYVDVSGSKSATRNFSIGGVDIPASVSGDLDVGIKGSAWTIAGEYRLQNTRESTVDLLFGARLLDIKPRTSYSLTGSLGSIPPANRSGSFEVKDSNWDAIIGVKSRYAFGDRLQWFVPLYADVGGGDSSLTYQLAAGIGYSFGWGDIVGMWRYVSYDMKSDDVIQDLTFNGPMLGVTFRW